MRNYIATHGLTNNSGVGILSIEGDEVEWDLISGDKVIESGISMVQFIPDPDFSHVQGEEIIAVFEAGELQIPLNECMYNDGGF